MAHDGRRRGDGPAGDRAHGDDSGGPGGGVRVAGRRVDLARVVAHRVLQLLEPGDGSPEGLGAVRLFTTGRVKSRERVVERRPDEVFSYVLEKGLAMRDYVAVITLTPVRPGGTTIEWRSTFRAKVPGTGGLYRRQLGKFIKETVDGLAAAAARTRAPEPQAGRQVLDRTLGRRSPSSRRARPPRGSRRPGAAGRATRAAAARPRPGVRPRRRAGARSASMARRAWKRTGGVWDR